MASEDQQVRGVGDGLVPWLAIVAWVACGASVGVLVGHALSVGLSVNEFGALGNWVAGLGTLGALVLAYFVHRRDVRARDDDLRREEIREYNRRKAEEDRVNAEDETQRRHASLVHAGVGVGGSYGAAEGSRYLSSLNMTVTNRSSEPVADVVLRTRWPSVVRSWLEVPPRDSKSARIRVRGEIEIPAGASEALEFVQEKIALEFRMYDRLWIWTPEKGVLERIDGQESAVTEKSTA